MTLRSNIIFVILILFICNDLYAQSGHLNQVQPGVQTSKDLEYFIEELRDISAQYQDINKAKMAGYISFGPDMPNMGEHFVLPERAVSRELDFSKPSVLCYLKIGGKHVLTGVAYTYPVVQGETPPDLPFDEMSWHYHSGNLQMEAYGITNHPESDNHDPEVRLAMLHAWIWSYNPDGVFTGDHWGLSFERSGLLPPPKIDPDASRALFMTHQGIQYYSRFMKLAIEPDPETYKELQSTLKTHTIKVEDLVSTLRKKQQISSKDQEELKQIWLYMWADIQKQVTEKEWFIISANLAHIHDH